MHGVGTQFAKHVDEKLGGGVLVYVAEQCTPDPEFPTVSSPNPEEKGALTLAISKAESLDIPLVVANDPDADRFSAAVKVNGKWRQLTGNEIGFLFADYIISSIPKEKLDKVYLLDSTVSSQMIGSMAKKLGFHFQDTLTGFKWIGNKAIDLEKEGYTVPFAYEEAIGFMFSVAHDKDGISALSVFLQMYQSWLKQGKTAIDVLEDGFKKYGYFKECNGYYIVPDLDTTPKVFNETIRKYAASGDAYPKKIGQFDVASWRDLTIGFDSTTSDNKPLLPVDSSSQMITCKLTLAGNDNEFVRFTARGSGTEPKLKVYIEASAETEQRATDLGKQVWDLLRDEWFNPESNKMIERV
ncbi:unnamed protein product [Ambrosiozyma monospora]|uniref:Unnamed protein product n=1 Tax=Ambrosiozyma monospora TaxID=43982 RepID=A0ACB5T4F9_AMBMO|nr:unnamed protein product [Ambrosiozyma monospora]